MNFSTVNCRMSKNVFYSCLKGSANNKISTLFFYMKTDVTHPFSHTSTSLSILSFKNILTKTHPSLPPQTPLSTCTSDRRSSSPIYSLFHVPHSLWPVSPSTSITGHHRHRSSIPSFVIINFCSDLKREGHQWFSARRRRSDCV